MPRDYEYEQELERAGRYWWEHPAHGTVEIPHPPNGVRDGCACFYCEAMRPREEPECRDPENCQMDGVYQCGCRTPRAPTQPTEWAVRKARELPVDEPVGMGGVFDNPIVEKARFLDRLRDEIRAEQGVSESVRKAVAESMNHIIWAVDRAAEDADACLDWSEINGAARAVLVAVGAKAPRDVVGGSAGDESEDDHG